MIKNRFEIDSGAYHFAREDILDFVALFGLETVLDDIIVGHEKRIQDGVAKLIRDNGLEGYL
jgi:hypothetical protein